MNFLRALFGPAPETPVPGGSWIAIEEPGQWLVRVLSLNFAQSFLPVSVDHVLKLATFAKRAESQGATIGTYRRELQAGVFDEGGWILVGNAPQERLR